VTKARRPVEEDRERTTELSPRWPTRTRRRRRRRQPETEIGCTSWHRGQSGCCVASEVAGLVIVVSVRSSPAQRTLERRAPLERRSMPPSRPVESIVEGGFAGNQQSLLLHISGEILHRADHLFTIHDHHFSVLMLGSPEL